MPEHQTPTRGDSGSEGPPGQPDLRTLFLRAFRAAEGSDSEASIAILQSSVCAFVREARARGDPPERVLAALKHCTADSIDALYLRGETPEQRALHESLFRWFLDEYYRED